MSERFRIYYGTRSGQKHADYATLEAAKRVADEVFQRTGIVLGIVRVESNTK